MRPTMSDEHLVPIAGAIVSDGKASRCGCFIQYEITFSGSSPNTLRAIAFDNYYVAAIDIEQGFLIERDGTHDINMSKALDEFLPWYTRHQLHIT